MAKLPVGALDAKSREELAKIEIGQTDITRSLELFLFIAFALICSAIPFFELARAAAGDEDARKPWALLREMPANSAAQWSARRNEAPNQIWNAVVSANRVILEGLHEFEESLEDGSRLAAVLRPPAQLLLSGVLGAGNEQVYVGRDRWLFYRPDIEYVTGPSFLDPEVQQRRIRTASEWTTPPQTDPRTAIISFKERLDAAGIPLIVVPVPVKPTVHPEMLARRASRTPDNPGFEKFVDDLRRAGVNVLDPTRLLIDTATTSGASQYLATDTHWRPEAMEFIAARLAEEVTRLVTLPSAAAPQYSVAPLDVTHHGDTFVMLDLPEQQALVQPETVTIRRILSPDGGLWRPSEAADVLVLGDSFSNIYSLESMGWGTSAGFAEQVSYALRRPVDRIVQNAAGAYATREILQRAGPERLRGKKVVVLQFAARELALGDWKVF